jgi:uncharacterized protein
MKKSPLSVYLIVTPGVLLLDYAGPAEALRMARDMGASLTLHTCGPLTNVPTSLAAQTNGLAHQQGTLLQQSRLASSLGVSSPAVERYIDLLVDLQLVRRLRPWSGNAGKRLVKAPKVYVRDSGLVHALLGLGNLHDLAGHPVCGPSFEGFCIDNLMAAANPQCTAYSYRTHAGADVDLLIERAGQPWMAIEIKRSTTPSLSKGFDIACADLNIEQRFVVYPGSERFPMRYGTQAIGLVELMQLLHKA